MSVLKKARVDFKETLETLGLQVYMYDEDSPKAPCVMVSPADPYMRPFSSEIKTMVSNWTVALLLIVIGKKGTKPANVDFIDESIENVVAAVEPHCTIVSVGRPGVVELSDGEYYGSVIEVEYNPPRS